MHLGRPPPAVRWPPFSIGNCAVSSKFLRIVPTNSDPLVKTFGTGGVSRRAWLVVALLWPVALLYYSDRLLITSMREAIKASLPMTEAQFGLLTSVFLWVYGAVSPFAGFLADRFGRRWMIVSSLLVWSLFTWLTGHSQSYRALFLARAGMGISEACYLPAALALICDYHRNATRSRAVGLHGTGLFAGTALGGIGGYLAQYCGWRTGFMIFGAIGVGYFLVLMLFLKDAPEQLPFRDPPPAQSKPSGIRLGAALRSLAAQPENWLLLGGLVPLGVAIWLVYGWLPTYLREHFHLGVGAGGLSATGYTQAATVAGLVVGGFWADRWARINSRGRIFVAGLGCAIAAFGLFVMASTPVLGVAIGALLFLGLGMGFYSANNMPILRQVVDQRYSATGMGILGGASCFAGGLMTYAGGALRDNRVDLAVSFKTAAVGVLIAGLLLLWIRPVKSGLPHVRNRSETVPLIPRVQAVPSINRPGSAFRSPSLAL